MSVSRRGAKQDPQFVVYYAIDVNGVQEGTRKFNRTKEENDNYAQGMALLGGTDISKSAYDAEQRKWIEYA